MAMTDPEPDTDPNIMLKRRWVEREFGSLIDALDERVARTEALEPSEVAALRDELVAITERIENADIAMREAQDRLDRVESRSGDASRFALATSEAMIPALRSAGMREPEGMSSSLSPYIVTSIRAEIENSRDAVADALYPVVGRMIRLSIASALEDLTRKVEDSLPFERWWAAITAKVTGQKSLARFARTPFTVREALLIERASGTLIARRPRIEDPDGIDPDLTGAMITSLVAFAEDALSADDETVRHIELSGSRFFLRASSGVIMAIRGTGQAPAGLARRLDTVFEQLLERLGAAGHAGPEGEVALTVLEDLREEGEAAARPPRKPMLQRPAVLIVLAMVIAGSILWGRAWIHATDLDHWRETLEKTARADERLTGYPLDFDVAPSGEQLTITGLAPDLATLRALRTRIDAVGAPPGHGAVETIWKVTTVRVERTAP